MNTTLFGNVAFVGVLLLILSIVENSNEKNLSTL